MSFTSSGRLEICEILLEDTLGDEATVDDDDEEDDDDACDEGVVDIEECCDCRVLPIVCCAIGDSLNIEFVDIVCC
jgi:hypothetical protein